MSITPPEPLALTARIAIALEAFLAIGALGGGDGKGATGK
jgi:hypothetical protein